MPVIIETARLKLRPLLATDAKVIAREIGNFKVSRNLARVPYPYTLEDAVDFIDWASTLDGASAMCAVEAKAAPGHLIGLMSYEYSADEQDSEFGYWLAENVWGQGFGKEAAAALVHHAFAVAGLDSLTAGFHNDNVASARILYGLGFVETGQAMQYSKAQNVNVPTTLLRLNRGEWLARK